MLQRIGLMLLMSGAWSFPAAAQDVGANHPDAFLYTAQAVLLILGMAFAGYWAYEAFDTPPIKLGDGPSPAMPLLRRSHDHRRDLRAMRRTPRSAIA